MVFRRRTNCKL